MANEESELIKKWVKCWQKAGIELEKLRREQIRQTNTQLAIENLNDAFEAAIIQYPPAPTSGLVEQQRFFRRLMKV